MVNGTHRQSRLAFPASAQRQLAYPGGWRKALSAVVMGAAIPVKPRCNETVVAEYAQGAAGTSI